MMRYLTLEEALELHPTRPDRRSPEAVGQLMEFVETYGQRRWHGRRPCHND